ncbi:MAG TPA: hypothetical protein VLH15_10425 [Dehalococcoidales bacterium]|nr:hypothetical protein [Dehalococcoidales bacterium]
MTTKLKLAVNDVQIKTDYFVQEFTEHTVIGMMGGLKGTGEVKELTLSVLKGVVKIVINERPVPVNEFASRIIISTLEGLLKPLKDVTFPINKIEIYVNRG